jgi:hypothetical protein
MDLILGEIVLRCLLKEPLDIGLHELPVVNFVIKQFSHQLLVLFDLSIEVDELFDVSGDLADLFHVEELQYLDLVLRIYLFISRDDALCKIALC